MPTFSSAGIAYSPGIIPADPKQLPSFLNEELRKVAASIALLAAGHLSVTYNAPQRQREGNIRLAAGTLEGAHWDPDGSGDRKLYQYRLISVGPSVYGWVSIG